MANASISRSARGRRTSCHDLWYGRQAEDFRTVDYDRTFTTTVGALQELKKEKGCKVGEPANTANITRRDKKISTLEQHFAALEATNKKRDKKFAKLERLLDSPSKSVPISID